MYHDQVLTPIKTLFEYDAINNIPFSFIVIDLIKKPKFETLSGIFDLSKIINLGEEDKKHFYGLLKKHNRKFKKFSKMIFEINKPIRKNNN